jgi:hypothetical protein
MAGLQRCNNCQELSEELFKKDDGSDDDLCRDCYEEYEEDQDEEDEENGKQ